MERCRVAVGRLVAVDPHPRALEHSGELVAVAVPREREQLSELRGVELVVGAARRFARLREQPQANGQIGSERERRSDAGSGRDAGSAPERDAGSVPTLVRAAGTASRRSGSMEAPVTSSMP